MYVIVTCMRKLKRYQKKMSMKLKSYQVNLMKNVWFSLQRIPVFPVADNVLKCEGGHVRFVIPVNSYFIVSHAGSLQISNIRN